MSLPLVSVLIPVYNAENYIEEALKSVLNQTYSNIEIIIGDDCSTDQSWEIISKYAKKYKNISAFKNKSNLYIALNRNKLLTFAKGEFIAWQDADDISLPTRIEKQTHFLMEHPKVGIVGGFLLFLSEGKVVSVRKYDESDSRLRKKIFRYSPVAQPAAMIRRECFKRLGNFNPEYPPAEDIDMSFRIGNQYDFANIQEPVIKYRQYEDSATFSNLAKIEKSTIDIRLKNARNNRYQFKLGDLIYNLLHYVSIYVIPSKIKIAIFNYIRNSQ